MFKIMDRFLAILARLFFVALLTLPFLPANAAEISLDEGDDHDLIFIEGEIAESDVSHFRRIALSSENASVILSSPGGALTSALAIGEIIRLKGFSTYVLNNQTCSSACALIWLAGSPRYLSTSAQVGFHASYYEDNGQQIETGLGNAMVGRYLTLLNLPERAVYFATSAPPDRMQYLNQSNTSNAGISFEIFDLEDTGNSGGQTVQNNSVSRGFEWESDIWSVNVSEDGSACFLAAQFDSDGSIDNSSTLLIRKANYEDHALLGFFNDKFRSVRSGQTYNLGIVFETKEVLDEGWGEKTFDGLRAEGDTSGGLSTALDWSSLREDIASEETIYFFLGNEIVDYFPLAGSRNALSQFDRCLKSLQASGLQDPFER